MQTTRFMEGLLAMPPLYDTKSAASPGMIPDTLAMSSSYSPTIVLLTPILSSMLLKAIAVMRESPDPNRYTSPDSLMA